VQSGESNPGSSIVFTQTSGMFYPCFDQPYNELVHTFHLARDSTSTPDRSESCLFKPLPATSTVPKRSSKSPVERSTLSNYIRLFEPMVIRALKHYTITSDVEQQSKVLQLLIQLVQLRVNYCLLDSDKIFVTYVLKQLDLIEEGQMLRAQILIPDMFKFLVLLSYEKYHSKPIIDVPKILQLCEGLFASGQSAEDFVMPALIPVAEDLFCSRASSDQLQMSELDAQREVMLTMLIKLLPYQQVIV
jgi:huntingtin